MNNAVARQHRYLSNRMRTQYPATAAELAFAIDPKARKAGKNWVVQCCAHADRQHPNLNICDGPGRIILLCCRAGCSQDALLAALRGLGLWSPERAPYIKAPPANWGFFEPRLEACCLEGPTHRCPHWAQFNAEYLTAYAIDGVRAAIEELQDKAYARADLFGRDRRTLTRQELREGVLFALPFGGIVPVEIDDAAAVGIVDDLLAEYPE